MSLQIIGPPLTPALDQQPASANGNAKLIGLFKALALRNSARVDIPIIGDSNTEGNGTSGIGSRWVDIATTALRQQHPTASKLAAGGLGFLPFLLTGSTTFSLPFTVTGSPGAFEGLGPNRWALQAAGTCTVAYTAPTGSSSLKIMYADASVAGSFTWKINSGSTTTITNGGTGDGKLSASITISAGQILTIAWVSGTVFLEGIFQYSGDETLGITLDACGHFGWACSDWNGTYSGFDWRPSLAIMAPSAIGIMLGSNDAIEVTAATFQANLLTLITYLRGNSTLTSIPYLLIIPPEVGPDASTIDTGGWAAYVAAMRALEASDSLIHCIDLNYRFPAEPVDTHSLYYSDATHFSNAGAALAGEYVAAGIGIH